MSLEIPPLAITIMAGPQITVPFIALTVVVAALPVLFYLVFRRRAEQAIAARTSRPLQPRHRPRPGARNPHKGLPFLSGNGGRARSQRPHRVPADRL